VPPGVACARQIPTSVASTCRGYDRNALSLVIEQEPRFGFLRRPKPA
jgi:hypothetical protein